MSTRSRSLRRDLTRLGIPTFALALAITVVTTYLPVVAQNFLGSRTIIGLLIGLEGIMALWVPLVAGSWSDALHTRVGGRLPFLIAATPVLALALAFMGFSNGIAALTVTALVFFLAYFVAYEPYRALYPDLVPDEVAGRAQSTQAVWRGAGTGVALVGGGLLIALGEPVPFVVAAVVVVAAMGLFVALARHRAGADADDNVGQTDSVREAAAKVRRLVAGEPALRAYLLANALWEASLGALKTFAFLFITAGLGHSQSEAAGIIGGVAGVVLIAAVVTGKLADRYGRTRLMLWVLPFYGAGILVPAFTQQIAIVGPLLVLLGLGGGAIMTLPYAVLQPLMPEGHHGALTGFYSLSRGIGTALGPLLAGVAIDALTGPFSSTKGYAAMWLVVGGTVLASIPALVALRRRADCD